MRSLALAIALLLMPATVAEACSGACFDSGGSSSGRSARAAKAPARTAARVAPRVMPRATPRPTPKPTPRPQTIAAALGLHRVNQVWAGDVTQKKGPVTTYTSKVVKDDPGTYAKRVATVTSGQKSAYDNVLSNKRTTMTDGRAVSGDIYANYIWTGTTLKLDRYVFFQDDRELARQPAPATARPTVAPVRSPAPTPAPRATPRPSGRSGSAGTTARHTATPRPARSTPRTVASTPRPTETPRPRTVTAGLALAAQGDMLARIEVLRGRRVDLWPRALIDGSPGRVTSWSHSSGELIALGPVAGSGDQPLGAMWDRITPPGTAFTVGVSVTVEVPGEGNRIVTANIDVVVRSPAIVE